MDAFYDKYGAKLTENSVLSENGECTLWTRARKPSGYGIIKCKNPNDNSWRTMHVHRLSYMVSKRMHFDDIEGKDVSHLCHNTLCTNSDHLSLETHHINRTREICMNRNLCTGHGGYENCRLQLRL